MFIKPVVPVLLYSYMFSFSPQTLDYKNGFMKPVVPVSVGKGGEPIHFNQISQNELDELAKFQPTLTYGQAKQVKRVLRPILTAKSRGPYQVAIRVSKSYGLMVNQMRGSCQKGKRMPYGHFDEFSKIQS